MIAPLVPKLYLGTLLLLAKFRFAVAGLIGSGATMLRGQVRSHVELGNEGNRGICFALFLLLAGSYLAHGADSANLPSVIFHGDNFYVREVDPKKEDLRLFLKASDGVYIHDFTGLESYLATRNEKLLFATNGGMFQPDSTPCGLLVQDGKEISPLNLNDGPGNFYMKPNGVFVINEKHEALVIQSGDYATLLTSALWATQSGPMLVLRGDINADFNADSKSLKIRSGVGVRKDGMIVFALSRKPVSFYEFASLFLNKLKCPNALFLDGEISAFHVPGKKDAMPHSFGPIIGVVEEAKKP